MSISSSEISNCGSERRLVRFDTIASLDRSMVPLACDVWLDDIAGARWATLEVLKLGTAITRYITGARNGEGLVARAESDYQLSRDDVMRCLYVMRSYGAVVSFTIESRPQVVLALNGLQQLKVLEACVGTRKHLRELGLGPYNTLRRRCRVREAGKRSRTPAD